MSLIDKVGAVWRSLFGADKQPALAEAHTPPRGHAPSYHVHLGPDLENQNYRQRLDEIQNVLGFRVRLSEYYNFGRIEPGRHGCFFGLEKGDLRPPSIIFSRCATLVKAEP